MPVQALTIASAPARARPGLRAPSPRLLLAGGTVMALAAAAAAATTPTAVDPDLVRVIRCMALIKGGFALAAFAACWWRLARPAPGWRGPVYVAGPTLMAGGAVALWSLQSVGLAALGLHAGLFGLLAAALTDPHFLDGWCRGVSGGAAAAPRRGRGARIGPAAPAAPGTGRPGPAASR